MSDSGAQFQGEYRAWCKSHGVKPRFGAIGKHGSIAVLERFIRSMKEECFRAVVVLLTVALVEQELKLWLVWYHEHRPHQGLAGKTPGEMVKRKAPAKAGRPARARRRGGRRRVLRPLELVVSHVGGRAHLPIVDLRPAA